MTPLHIDIETRSAVDLTKTGVYVYSVHPSTRILVVSWRLGAEPVQRWYPLRDPSTPLDLLAAMADPGVIRVAHNASFERIMLNSPIARRLGFPDTADVALWDCTAARAAAFGLPRTLEGSGAALGLEIQKDRDGHALMMKMCKPRKPLKADFKAWDDYSAGLWPVTADPPPDPNGPLWHETPEQFDRLGEYCDRDVLAECAIYDVLPPLSPVERAVWETTERMNDRGVPVDARLLAAMLRLIEEATGRINRDIADRTFGAVPAVSNHMALTRWLLDLGIDDAEDGVGKAAVAAMIENPEIEGFVREVLILRRDGGGSSVSKYGAILKRLSDDSRIRGVMVYCGAASTGRWSSRGAQLHNLPRGGSVKNIESAVRDLLDGADIDYLAEMYGPPLVVATEALRPLFGARPDAWVARGDYSQIEARVNPWLAGAEWKLNAFRAYDTITGWTEKNGKPVPVRGGPDLYRVGAAGVYGIRPDDVTDAQRQIGKVSELALGFGGGKAAFQAMAKAYGVRVSDGQAEDIKQRWRAANPEIVGLWYGLDYAAVECMSRPPGEDVPVVVDVKGRPLFRTGLSFRRSRAVLTMRLPSGRRLFYWTPRLRDMPVPWGGTKPAVIYRAEDSQTKRWREFVGYGGLFCENPVQGFARDIMAIAMVSLERLGYSPVLSVHDEAICLMPKSVFPTAAEAADAVAAVMLDKPAYCGALPVAADSSAGPRYVKA